MIIIVFLFSVAVVKVVFCIVEWLLASNGVHVLFLSC